MIKPNVSKQTRNNWLIDAALFGSAIAAVFSGIYFLYLPNGGYQGGRNPQYGIQILFTRQTWDDIHTWGGVIMLAAAIIHLAIHWNWVKGISRRIWNEVTGKCAPMSARNRWNVILNSVVITSFVLTGISGVYFLFVPGGRGTVDPLFLFSRTTWDLVHTWAGVSFIASAILHFVIHWQWVVKVTHKMVSFRREPQVTRQAVAVENS
jgi:hypothetical protein